MGNDCDFNINESVDFAQIKYTSEVAEYTFPVDRALKVGFGTTSTKVTLASARSGSAKNADGSGSGEPAPNLATVRVQLSGEDEASVKAFVPKVSVESARSELTYNKPNSKWYNGSWFSNDKAVPEEKLKTVRASVEIYLPEADVTPVTELDLNIVSGSIGISNINTNNSSAEPAAEPKTGPLAHVAFGKLKLNTVNGSITIPGVTAEVFDANCVNGNIHLDGVTARSAKINTVNGEVIGSFASASDLKVNSINGNITGRLLSTGSIGSDSAVSSYKFNTMNGNCAVGVSKHFAGSFKFSTYVGGVHLPNDAERIRLTGDTNKSNNREGYILPGTEKADARDGSSRQIKAESWNGALQLFFF